MFGEGQSASGPGDVKYLPGSLQTEVLNDGTLFRLTLQAPRSMRQHPEFENVIWDECLRRAHAAGHMPVGSILIDTEDVEQKKPETLEEGEPMAARTVDTLFALGGIEPIMKVTAEVMLGLSLG